MQFKRGPGSWLLLSPVLHLHCTCRQWHGRRESAVSVRFISRNARQGQRVEPAAHARTDSIYSMSLLHKSTGLYKNHVDVYNKIISTWGLRPESDPETKTLRSRLNFLEKITKICQKRLNLTIRYFMQSSVAGVLCGPCIGAGPWN